MDKQDLFIWLAYLWGVSVGLSLSLIIIIIGKITNVCL